MTDNNAPADDVVARLKKVKEQIEDHSWSVNVNLDYITKGIDAALEAALSASPGSSAGAEPFAWHWWAKNHSETWPVWSQGAERPAHAPDSAIALYKHQPSAPPQREGLERLADTIETMEGDNEFEVGYRLGFTTAADAAAECIRKRIRALTGKGGE